MIRNYEKIYEEGKENKTPLIFRHSYLLRNIIFSISSFTISLLLAWGWDGEVFMEDKEWQGKIVVSLDIGLFILINKMKVPGPHSLSFTYLSVGPDVPSFYWWEEIKAKSSRCPHVSIINSPWLVNENMCVHVKKNSFTSQGLLMMGANSTTCGHGVP